MRSRPTFGSWLRRCYMDEDEVALARRAMEIGGSAILRAAARLSGSFPVAVQLIAGHPGKILLTGIGKSGRIAAKLAATFSSTGTAAVFLHAAEALHGDSGVVAAGDPVIVISKSGHSSEILKLLSILPKVPIIAITGDLTSPLATAATAVLDASVEVESDPFDLVPSASSGVALALGHALAIAVMMRKGWNPEQFATVHPEGDLGRLLTRTVREALVPPAEVARVDQSTTFRDVLIAMTKWPTGAACVVDPNGRLEGLITDGDIRRCLERFTDISRLIASDIMTREPISIQAEATLFDAARVMENRPRQLSVLPVVDSKRHLLGLLRLHDVVRTELGSR